ncbi:MAG: polysaccharide deacetylase family protein [Chloroflexi bacterium]|nr:polysaccharide deacetylase family protein [Chloroflexota bacterium]
MRSFPQITPTGTDAIPFESATPTPGLPTPSPIPTIPTVFQGPDLVTVPILLYHRIDVSQTNSLYYITPENFEEQLRLLRNWGYNTITTELLVKAITQGADLPQHPILITFDDGHLDNYTTAFPIMQKYGFTGVMYIVGGYMGAPEYMNADQIKEMAAAGWEVGSHGMTHLDLTSLDSQGQRYEIFESRKLLEKNLGVPILTFAYPFGSNDPYILDYTYLAGYIAGMGLGPTSEQIRPNLFTLQRRDVSSAYDLKTFSSFLPWQGDKAFLPTDTPTPEPTFTRTPIPTYTLFPTNTSAP